MLEKAIIIILVTVLMFFIYEAVHDLWTIDICISYYQRYGDYNYTAPLSGEKASTWDCYHRALNDMIFYMLGIVVVSLLLGSFIGSIGDKKTFLKKREERKIPEGLKLKL